MADVCIDNHEIADYKDESDVEELNSNSSNTSIDTVKSNEYLSSYDTIVAEITTSAPLNNRYDST